MAQLGAPGLDLARCLHQSISFSQTTEPSTSSSPHKPYPAPRPTLSAHQIPSRTRPTPHSSQKRSDQACHVLTRFAQKPCHVLNTCHVFNTPKRDTLVLKTGHYLPKQTKRGLHHSKRPKQVHSVAPPCHENNRFPKTVSRFTQISPVLM